MPAAMPRAAVGGGRICRVRSNCPARGVHLREFPDPALPNRRDVAGVTNTGRCKRRRDRRDDDGLFAKRSFARRRRCAAGRDGARLRHVVVRRLPGNAPVDRRCIRRPRRHSSPGDRGRPGPRARPLVSGEALADARLPPRRPRSRTAGAPARHGIDQAGARGDRHVLVSRSRHTNDAVPCRICAASSERGTLAVADRRQLKLRRRCRFPPRPFVDKVERASRVPDATRTGRGAPKPHRRRNDDAIHGDGQGDAG